MIRFCLFILFLTLILLNNILHAHLTGDLGDTGIVFSATSLDYANNCTIREICKSNLSVILFLPKLDHQSVQTTYTCPTIIYVPFVSITNILIPKVTAIIENKNKKAIPLDRSLIYARSFKIRSIQHCPFKQTLYLDNDINIMNLNKLLFWFEIMKDSKKLISMKNDRTIHPGHHYREIIDFIPERNSGVMYFMCENRFVLHLLHQWEHAYFHLATEDYHDQGPLRVVLNRYKNRDIILDLPENYNCRYELRNVTRSECHVNHVHEKYHGLELSSDIVGPRSCTLD